SAMSNFKRPFVVALIAVALVPGLSRTARAQSDRRAVSQNDARRELAANNYAFDEQVFLERVRERDAAAVELFIAAGMNPNAKDKDGVTALMRAAFNDQVEIVRLLLDRGAELNATDKDNWTALYVAAWNGNAASA